MFPGNQKLYLKMELEKHKTVKNSLYNLAQQTLTVSLLKIRKLTSSPSSMKVNLNSLKVATFLFQELVERIKTCQGIEIIHLISALPHSGLRPDLLQVLESYHPVRFNF